MNLAHDLLAPDLLARYDAQLRRAARPDGPGCRVERVGAVVRQTGPAHAWNGVLWSGLDAGTADAAIAAQLAHYRAEGVPFEWKLYGHDGPADLGARLLTAGFEAEEPETLLVAEASAQGGAVPLPDGVELRDVTDPEGVRQVVEVYERAFGTDSSDLGRRLLDRLAADPGTVTAVLALADGVPVSAARLELYPGTDFAGLWGGGTVEQWRGRGLYRALVAHRARVAAVHGHRWLQVDAAPTSRPILQRLGFVPLTTTTPYVHA
ncbi:GNAT family N-acetyltransferase [Streptomyces sp. R302]|uniref:GNAT family N-acetyltransferase n=1 Tax=unclassified Streptomyces TaxID=2593676 RepID=UPI00145F2656|nr:MULTISPECIES: GNAT family N-acetyltransferase [unclassified Streptomyces]NML52778.1 GNAT family N-acetyltransferase [Streptomyces sp. R301]NML80293.1 GNAT family N-acetyltransferase [Streptomyces sp. R302]